MNKQVYQILLLVLIVASFFHMQSIAMAVTAAIIFTLLKEHLMATRMGKLFAFLLVPAFFGLIVGYQNNSYLILKDFYYFAMPVIFTMCGILLACKLDIGDFLKTLVWAGVCTSIIVTFISMYYVGPTALTNPYSAHYAVGIVGTPGPPVAIACLLFTRKFHIKLFSRKWFNILLAINVFGLYMFASRTYLIVAVSFLFLMVANHIKRSWILPVLVCVGVLIALIPTGVFTTKSQETFMGKLLSSFNEISIGNYDTEQDINIRYRGYESFMAINGYMDGQPHEMLFGGLGKLVDLKTFVRLGEDTDYRYIPVLHNGWLYILVKTGAVGVLFYLSIFIGLIVVAWRKYADKSQKIIIRLFAALCIGCTLSLLFTNYIITSFSNVEMSVLMITLGYSYYHFRQLSARLKEHRQIEPAAYNYVDELNYSL